MFTAALTAVTALLCGILPALELCPRGEALRRTARYRPASASGAFRALVAALAIAVVLLGGGLLLRSFSRLMAVDPARAERVPPLRPAFAGGQDAASVRGFYTRLVDDDVACRASVRSAPPPSCRWASANGGRSRSNNRRRVTFRTAWRTSA